MHKRSLSWPVGGLSGYCQVSDTTEAIITHCEFAGLLSDLLVTVPEWFDDGLSEYALIQRLQGEPFCLFEADALRDPLVMFQTHFMVFHALYRVQTRWREDNTGELTIHTTRISLVPSTHTDTTLPDNTDPLRDYYLNWDNFTDTGKQDVEAMLNDFWRRFAGGEGAIPSEQRIVEAKVTLELPPDGDLDRTALKRQYRRLQHQHHPDKGGDNEKTRELVKAYTTLCRIC